MLSLMKGALGSSVSYQDKIMYMTAVGLNHTIGSDKTNNAAVVENIFQLVTSNDSRYIGFQLLELALEQNSDLFHLGKWNIIIFDILKDPSEASLVKMQVCKILTMLIPLMAKDRSTYAKDLQGLFQEICPILLQKIAENVEWAEDACNCFKECLKTFPDQLVFLRDDILNVILLQASCNVSSKLFEVLADCFCEIPYCNRDVHVDTIKRRWSDQYLRTLKTIENLLVDFLKDGGSESYTTLDIDIQAFKFKEAYEDKDVFHAHMKSVRRFINLCKCLAKMLSNKSRYPASVPVQCTIKCMIPLFTTCKKEKVTGLEEEILYTSIAQMRVACLLVLESLILNCDLLKHSVMMKGFIVISLRSTLPSISSEPVSELRAAIWRLLNLWLGVFGGKVSKDIAGNTEIINGLLNDISIEVKKTPQVTDLVQAQNKSKKIVETGSNYKSSLKLKNQQKVCKEALNTIETLLYTGTNFIQKDLYQGICNRIFKISKAIHSFYDTFPSPYNDESCRKKLYSVVLAIVTVSRPDDIQNLQTAISILTDSNKDPSFKIRSLTKKASAICRLQLHPKRPPPVYTDIKRQRPNTDVVKFSEWTSDHYVPDIKITSVSEASENVNRNIENSFQNQVEIETRSEEYMEMDTNYPEQVIQSQCNGEEILEIQSSSQCQDDESDEEEEEEEEERAFGEEEPAQVYIPPSRKMHVSNIVNSEIVHNIDEPEYEELTPCIKTDENMHKKRSKDKHVNGEGSMMPDENMPSSSTQQVVANENGIYGVEDEDVDEEDEEEEESNWQPAEKRAEYYDQSQARKKQKTEVNNPKEDVEVDVREENSRSPTLEEMKANVIEMIPSIEDVQSGNYKLAY